VDRKSRTELASISLVSSANPISQLANEEAVNDAIRKAKNDRIPPFEIEVKINRVK
jgi:hypothetical protein